MNDEVLILCVDRDDDIGRKTEWEGPVVGRDENIELAKSLGIADPEDSDANAIFRAVNLHDERDNSRIATITGDVHVGIESDEKLMDQLKEVLDEADTDRVILVTDGVEDEHIVPIIQNHAEILSVQKVIMKQSERLEGMYYQMNDFLKEVVNDPKMAKLALGVPAMILLLYSLFGVTGWRAILGIIGTYLLIKGFHLEGPIVSVFDEIKTSFTARRLTFFFYVVSLGTGAIAVKGGYDMIQVMGALNYLEMGAAFISGSVYLLFLAALIAIVGKTMTTLSNKGKILRYATFTSFLLALSLIGSEASKVILNPEMGLRGFITAIILGFVIVFLTLTSERAFAG